MLFPTKRVAEQCRAFIQRRAPSPVNPRIVHLFICPEDDKKSNRESIVGSCADLHIVVFPQDIFPIAKQFWQHTGMGISSRLAEKCLSLLAEEATPTQRPASPLSSRFPGKGQNRHYAKSGCKSPCFSPPPAPPVEDFNPDHSVYLEERYGRNLPLSAAAFAKKALRYRVAGVLREGCQTEQQELVINPSSRGVASVSPDDVYLYPGGMAAIWNAHNLAMDILPSAKSICFGWEPSLN